MTTLGHSYHHKIPSRTHPKVGIVPKRDPSIIMPCPTCSVSVLAKAHRYWEPDETLHEHEPAKYNVSEEEARDFA